MAQTKAPALVKRLTAALTDLGYTVEEAQDMISNEGTASIATFIEQELQYAKQQKQESATTKVSITPTEDKDVAIVCEVDSNGKYKSVKTIDTGLGIQAARPLPAPVQIQTEPTPAKPSAELMYDYNLLPVALQRLVDDISLHRLPTKEALPVLHCVGFNQETKKFIFKCVLGQAVVEAYKWLHLTDAKAWQNLGFVVVAPTDPALLKIWCGCYQGKYLPAQADYKLLCPSVLEHLSTLDFSQFTKVVAPPASEPAVAVKVQEKARKADAKAQEPTKVEPVSEDLLQQLAVATNHMKKVSLVNKLLVAQGEPKVASKITKAELQPTIDRLLSLFGVEKPEVQAKEPAAKATKTKAAKEPAAKALTKAEIQVLWIAAYQRETGADAKAAKQKFAALDINWRSSVERAQFVVDQGLV